MAFLDRAWGGSVYIRSSLPSWGTFFGLGGGIRGKGLPWKSWQNLPCRGWVELVRAGGKSRSRAPSHVTTPRPGRPLRTSAKARILDAPGRGLHRSTRLDESYKTV